MHWKNHWMNQAYERGNEQEKYAMENGEKKMILLSNDHDAYMFTLPDKTEYQAENEYVYDIVRGKWEKPEKKIHPNQED